VASDPDGEQQFGTQDSQAIAAYAGSKEKSTIPAAASAS
jgi:hypothetical protein